MIAKIMDKINVYLQLKKDYMIRSSLDKLVELKKVGAGKKKN